MLVVVLNVPSLRHHPVCRGGERKTESEGCWEVAVVAASLTEPVTSAVPHRTDGKLEAVETTFVGVALVVAAVASMVRNHSPAREGESGEHNHGENIDPVHEGGAKEEACVGPEDDLGWIGETKVSKTDGS